MEDYSNDEESSGITPPKSSNGLRKTKIKRPKIIKRRGSRSIASNSIGKDWGERCVEGFEMIAQIGEGTYGQVTFNCCYVFKISVT